MATTLYFRLALSGDAENWSQGIAFVNLASASVGLQVPKSLAASRGSSGTGASANTASGPTSGIEPNVGSAAHIWATQPLASDVTIAGSVSATLWGAESNVLANVAIGLRLLRVAGSDGAITEIGRSALAAELGTTTSAQALSLSPTSTDCKRGDRLLLTPYFDDGGGTMQTGYSATFDFDGTTGDRDSSVTFTETLTFESAPTGTAIYPTTAASDINPGALTEYEAWTSRGSGATEATKATAAGWTAPLYPEVGGTGIEWYTKTLAACTLDGPVKVQFGSKSSVSLGTTGALRCEIAVVDGDGSNAVVWATSGSGGIAGNSESSRVFYVGGESTAISAGQRLQIRLLFDDSVTIMLGSRTLSLYFAGAASGSGDTVLTFPITLAEGAGGGGDGVAGMLIGSKL